MNIEEIMMFELEGLKKTICDYTTDNYIVSYTNQLSKLKYPEDSKKLHILSQKILSWYKEAIVEIDNNQYVFNKNNHKKSYQIMCELKNQTCAD